ncbi:hypothetical protein GLYMA_15G092700v4 [Glycine max]|uniref:PIG-P domain-containing protein n=4 Tax=Glycine subgen. Soja TaxID=1462606 RepID=K7MAH6_SOYBN|nr:uncharacterized protein LOC100802825 isoform X1 [Glycine max]KAG4381189.1 hypothetical protein GLYMA_15G092700v4 [Glycine max]KAH1146350.1 hypothetical protein GYH30_041829 [Glycine max]KAH1146351.1 hypothetical protein GYH30_041829 [Glycine max]KAH1208417.1 Phosphatidylinositol N-acetylglucosaminyltransferase subunit P [Glycine max]KRH11158.1 hypothetical protein GLYMA_15G092700v4 [Glycine max]|eukprot:XP_014623634.1 uncharacterized protein LOC100802825 isoform X1 [Glycine max]
MFCCFHSSVQTSKSKSQLRNRNTNCDSAAPHRGDSGRDGRSFNPPRSRGHCRGKGPLRSGAILRFALASNECEFWARVGSPSRTVYSISFCPKPFRVNFVMYALISMSKSVSGNGCDMESPHSQNSPRRTLSLSKKRRATASCFDPDEISSGFGLSGDHGPKPSEVYGFVGSITTVVATVIFLVWAYVPESWLQSVGISYYPSRYWALAVPTYVMVTIVLMLGFYIGLNFISTPSPASLNTVFDEFSRDPLSLECTLEDEKPIEPISDIGIDRINDIMFKNNAA